MREVRLRNSDSGVDKGYFCLFLFGCQRYTNFSPRLVVHYPILQQAMEYLAEPCPISFDIYLRFSGKGDTDPFFACKRRHLLHQFQEKIVQFQLLKIQVEPPLLRFGKEQEILHYLGHFLDLVQVALKQLTKLDRLLGQPEPQLGFATQNGQGSAQFMGDVYGKLPGPSEGVFQPAKHVIESLGQLSDFITRVHHFQAVAQVFRSDLLGATGDKMDRFESYAGKEPSAVSEKKDGQRNGYTHHEEDIMESVRYFAEGGADLNNPGQLFFCQDRESYGSDRIQVRQTLRPVSYLPLSGLTKVIFVECKDAIPEVLGTGSDRPGAVEDLHEFAADLWTYEIFQHLVERGRGGTKKWLHRGA